MAGSLTDAEMLDIMRRMFQLEERVLAAEARADDLLKELNRVMQAAANGAYCRRSHTKDAP